MSDSTGPQEFTMDEPTQANRKRKRVVLTIKDKIDICKRLERGESRAKLMEDYGIGSSTVYGIQKQKVEFLKFRSATESTKAIAKRRVLRKPKLEQLDSTLYEWFMVKRSEGVPVSGPMLIEKAKDLYVKMELTEKCAFSDGWLAGFRTRHGIRKLDVRKSSDHKAAKEYTEKFAKLVKEHNLTLEQIYNAGETGLLLPDEILTSSDEKVAAGFRLNKEQLTVLCCANAAGTHRVKLLVVGKYQCPQEFKDSQHLPVEYTVQPNSCMERNIFKHWFFKVFVPSVKKHFHKIGLPEDSKCILLLDNCNPFPKELELQSGNIFVVYLPPNVTALIQPMDQGVIQNMKWYYQRDFLCRFVNCEGPIEEFRGACNIKDAIYNVAYAWNLVKAKTLRRAWRRLWPAVMTPEVPSGKENLENLQKKDTDQEMVPVFKEASPPNLEYELKQEDIEKCIDTGKEVVLLHTSPDEDLIDTVPNPDPETKNLQNESFSEEIAAEKTSWDDTATAFCTLLKFAESQPCYSAPEVVQLHSLHSIFLQKWLECTGKADIFQVIKEVCKAPTESLSVSKETNEETPEEEELRVDLGEGGPNASVMEVVVSDTVLHSDM